MTWFRCGGGSGIPASLKSQMNAVLNKKFGTSIDYPADGWPDDVDLLGLLEEKTASGSIVTFSDGADDVPLKSCKVALSASLEGYSSVEVVQMGKNLFDGSASYIANNYISFYGNKNVSGATTGTALKKGTYTITITLPSSMDGNGFGVYGCYLDELTQITFRSNFNTNPAVFTVTLTEDRTINFWVYMSADAIVPADCPLTTVQIEVGSSSSSYTAYTAPTTHTANLGRTIHGGTPDVVKGEGSETHGKKVFDGTEGTGGTPSWTMISVTQGTMFRITVSDKATTSATNTLCSYYTPVAQAQRVDGTVSGAGTNVDIIDNRFSSVDEFKAWLSENPVTLVYELDIPTDFTFEPVEISSKLGDNTMWSDGDMEVVYRASGTVTPIQPTLISKNITANGTYSASDDGADGYDAVVVNVPTAVSADPIMSANAFVTKSGVSGTDTSTVARSFTMSAAGTLIFAAGTYGFTNTGSNDGYFEIQKNGVSVVKQYCNTSTNTPIAVPDISVEENDVVDLIVGFDNAHSNCNFQFYSAMVVVSEV